MSYNIKFLDEKYYYKKENGEVKVKKEGVLTIFKRNEKDETITDRNN